MLDNGQKDHKTRKTKPQINAGDGLKDQTNQIDEATNKYQPMG